jgi:membrane-bound lytic murein transglycosylase F
LLPALTLALALTACQPQAPPPQAPPNTLTVIARPAPGSWFNGPQDAPQGFEHDLIARFARDAHLDLVAVTADSAADLVRQVAHGEARVGLGGLLLPAQRAVGARGTHERANPDRDVLWTIGIRAVEPMLIYDVEGYKPRDWADLEGAEVAYLADAGVDDGFASLRAAHPGVRFHAVEFASADELIAAVDDARVDYAVVSATDVALARNIHLNFDVAFSAGPKRELAWAVPASQAKLRDELDAFIRRAQNDGTIAALAERYLAPVKGLPRIDAGALHERVETVLPSLRAYFEAAQDATGLDWRLVAAVAYQESQWDTDATSETGVRGIMQVTADTAKRLGLDDRLDPESTIIAAARYLRDLRDGLPAHIAEPDRTFMMLAAFNIGLGHLEDARVLAQRQGGNPDRWDDVRKALPLLADPQYFNAAKLGYARGGMPVAFVQRVRAYYDILARSLPPHLPRLRGPVLDALAGP